MSQLLVIAVLSYLLGSIPFGYLLVRFVRGEDVRLSGSGNIGATNVGRKSPALGLLTLVLDALKGCLAVMIGVIGSPTLFGRISIPHMPWRFILPAGNSADFAPWAALAALFAVVGHMFPVWLKFHGGKGVATGLGAFALIAPWAVLLSAVVFAVFVLVFRYVSLGSIAGVAAFPYLAWLLSEFGGEQRALAMMAVSSILIIAKHHANIRRLLSGTENRIGSKQAANQGNQ